MADLYYSIEFDAPIEVGRSDTLRWVHAAFMSIRQHPTLVSIVRSVLNSSADPRTTCRPLSDTSLGFCRGDLAVFLPSGAGDSV